MDELQYEYPQGQMFKGSYRWSLGWFLAGEYDDEPACYVDIYFIGEDDAILVLDEFYRVEEIELM